MPFLSDDDRRAAQIAISSGLIGLAVAVARRVIVRRHGSWLNWIQDVVAGALFTAVVGLAMADTAWPDARQKAILVVCALVGGDVMAGLFELGRMVREAPMQFIKDVWFAFRYGPRGREERRRDRD